jgi:L-iditol 2-dehydrogenase
MLGLTKTGNGPGLVELRDKERPRPRPGYVLLEVAAAGICGTDIHIVKGEYRVIPPVTIGHEVCGYVCEVGEGVDPGRIGSRVVSETFFSTCGRCTYCRNGRPNMCNERKSIGTHVNGAMAAFLEVPEAGLHTVPEWLSDAAASMAEPVACVTNSMFDRLPYVGPDNEVLVIGPGTIGLLAAQVARACGAKVHVRGTPRDRARLDLAERLGFSVSDIGTALPDASVDRVVECSGAGPGIAEALRVLSKGGELMQMGIVGQEVTLPFDHICYKELRVTSGFASNPQSWRRAMRLINDRAITLDLLVTEVAPLQDWQAIFDRTMASQGVKFVFDPRLKAA